MENIFTDARQVMHPSALKEVAIFLLNVNDQRGFVKCVHRLRPKSLIIAKEKDSN